MIHLRRGSNPQPPNHQSDAHPIEPSRSAIFEQTYVACANCVDLDETTPNQSFPVTHHFVVHYRIPLPDVPSHAKPCLRAYADSEGPDQTAHPRSLIRAFTVRKQNHSILQNVRMENKSLGDTLSMRRMI